MSALNCSLLGKEQTNTAQKALAFIIYISTLCLIFLSEIMMKKMKSIF